MRRSVLILSVALKVLLAGCTGIGIDGAGDDDIDVETDDGADSVELESEDDEEDAEAETETDDSEGTNPVVDGELEIHHIDVGQADSTLIITPEGETILVDTGDWRQSGQGVIEYPDAHEIDRIDHLVATHAHADHIGGHDEIEY